jgi:flagellar biosynthetic protein FlhB
MPQQDDAEERTEDASPRRREQAREEGRTASSREVGTLFILTSATLGIYYLGPYMTGRAATLFVYFFQNLSTTDLSPRGAAVLLQQTFVRLILLIGPLMLILVVAAIAGYVVQVGFLISGKPLQPNPSRLNPVEGAKRIFSTHMLAETAKSIIKFIVVGMVSYKVLDSVLIGSPVLIESDPKLLIPAMFGLGIKLALMILVFLLAEALGDYAFQRWQFEKSIRMSRYELKQELKETEGDPQIKARVRSIRQQQARQKMMKEVPKAEVVVTNPTHFAIAIRYDSSEREAPHVVAKGQGLIAQRIKEIALENNVPLYEDKWLARQLFKTCNIGDLVPIDLWQAVAKVLAYVRTLGRKRLAVGA